MDSKRRLNPPGINECLKFLLRILFLYQKLEEGWTIKKREEDSFDLMREINSRENFSFS